MIEDLRIAWRIAWQRPAATLLMIAALGLGIALTTTMASVADNLLLKPLPYPAPDRLYLVFGAIDGDTRSGLLPAPADLDAWRASGVMSGTAAYRAGLLIPVRTGSDVRRLKGALVDEHFLSTLGVSPVRGRGFTSGDCQVGAAPVTLLSDAFWHEAFGADPNVVGTLVDIDEQPTRVIGVLPADFVFPAIDLTEIDGGSVAVVLPLAIPLADRGHFRPRGLRVVGRLDEGVSVDQASERLSAVQRALKPSYDGPANVRPGAFDGVMMRQLAPALRPFGIDRAVELLLLSAIGVFLVGSVNLANLMLARGHARRRELAVRSALGASRGRLVRLILSETILLAGCGGLVGIAVARWSFTAIVTILPQGFVALRMPVIDGRVAVGSWLFSVAVAAGFSVLPAWRLARADVNDALKETTAAIAGMPSRLQDGLVFAEIALAVALVGAGALVLRTFVNVLGTDPGFDSAHVLTMNLAAPRSFAGEPGRTAEFFARVLEKVKEVPGVEGAALTNSLLMKRANFGTDLSVEGMAAGRLRVPGSLLSEVRVTPEYFTVMGMGIERGRSFDGSKRSSPAEAVVADQLGRLAAVDVLGRTLVSLTDPAERYQVVGVVRDSHERARDLEPLSMIYLPFSSEGPATLVARAASPAPLASAIERAIHVVEPAAVVDHVRTLDDLLLRSVATRRFNVLLYGAFSASALLLSALGVYGVVAYSVSRRIREVGVRIALGASTSRVMIALTTRTLAITAAATIAGLALLGIAEPLLRSLVLGVEPSDPATLGIAALVLGVSAVVAGTMPAYRAARIDPVTALRTD